MPTQTGRNARTLTSYVETLLDYPRWIIERDVDFTECLHQGSHSLSAEVCTVCVFGDACHWLRLTREPASPDDPLSSLLNALTRAADYLQVTYSEGHSRGCSCENCLWLRQVRRFLHAQDYKT